MYDMLVKNTRDNVIKIYKESNSNGSVECLGKHLSIYVQTRHSLTVTPIIHVSL